MSDILFHTDVFVFSYRVAGVLLRDGKILLQKPTNDSGFALPGGHVEFGETTARTLEREFREELGADIAVGDLKWVAEIFFPWGSKPCQQICLYYEVHLKDEAQIPLDGVFIGDERMEGQNFKIQFHWMPVDKLGQIEVYPTNIVELLQRFRGGIQHFIYREEV